VDSEHAHLVYRYENGRITVVDKHEGSFGVITPDVQRALNEKRRRDGDGYEGEGALSFLKRTNRAFRNA
jgi:hypothetical protein